MTEKKRLTSIDGLRGFGAIYILYAHHFSAPTIASHPALQDLMYRSGLWFVDLFFCASGFLVYGAWTRRAPESRTVSAFYLRRFARIIPLWWAVLFFGYLNWAFSLPVLLANMFFVFGFLAYNRTYLPIVPAWSLFVEETFYLVFPWIFSALTKERVIYYCLTSIIVASFWLDLAPQFGVPTAHHFVVRSPIANLQYFLAGILIYHVYRNPTVTAIVLKPIGTLPLTWFDAFSIAGLFSPPRFSSWCFSTAIILLTTVTPGTMFSRVFDNPFFRWVGMRCYFIYLVHTLIIYNSEALTTPLLQALNLENSIRELQVLVLFPINLALALVLAWYSFALFEMPCMRLAARLEKYLQKPRTGAIS